MEPITIFLVSALVRKFIYPLIRPHLKKAINDKDKEWDDVTMKAADEIFNYQEKRRKENDRKIESRQNQ